MKVEKDLLSGTPKANDDEKQTKQTKNNFIKLKRYFIGI